MKLKPRQICPIHKRRNCCGRDGFPKRISHKYVYIEPGVRILEDGRQKRSPAAMRRLVDQKIKEQNGVCGICNEPLTFYPDVVGAHKKSKGMNGWKADDSPANICAAHKICNLEAGSKEIA